MKLNHLKYRAKYRWGRYLNLTRPVDVSLELSSLCNMACEYCYHSAATTPFKKGFMEKDVAFAILESAARYGVHSVKMNWKGESTLNPNFRDICLRAKELAGGDIFIDRLSNSNFKFPTKREDIFEGLCAQTKVKVSFDSFRADVFETQRAKGKHSLTLANIDKFYNYPGRNNELVIQAVRTKLNKDEDIFAETKKRWPSAHVSIRDMVEGRIEKDLDDLTNKKRDAKNRKSCLQAHVRLIFNHEGYALPCCPDIKEQLCLGDIKAMNIYEIFNGPQAKELRRSLKSKEAFDHDPCKSCSSFESYKGYKHPWNS